VQMHHSVISFDLWYRTLTLLPYWVTIYFIETMDYAPWVYSDHHLHTNLAIPSCFGQWPNTNKWFYGHHHSLSLPHRATLLIRTTSCHSASSSIPSLFKIAIVLSLRMDTCTTTMWVNEDTPENHINMYFKQRIVARGLHETADEPFQ